MVGLSIIVYLSIFDKFVNLVLVQEVVTTQRSIYFVSQFLWGASQGTKVETLLPKLPDHCLNGPTYSSHPVEALPSWKDDEMVNRII